MCVYFRDSIHILQRHIFFFCVMRVVSTSDTVAMIEFQPMGPTHLGLWCGYMCNKIKQMLQQSCRHCSTHDNIILWGYFSCNKIKQNMYLVAAFILFYCTWNHGFSYVVWIRPAPSAIHQSCTCDIELMTLRQAVFGSQWTSLYFVTFHNF